MKLLSAIVLSGWCLFGICPAYDAPLSLSELGHSIYNFTTGGVFTRFAHHDIASVREIGLVMGDKVFENRDRGNVQLRGGANYFSFGNGYDSASSRFNLVSMRVADKLKAGYGMVTAHIGKHDDIGIGRISKMRMFYMPISYNTDAGYEFVVNPRAGFVHSEYTRIGFDGAYNGYVENRMVGIVSDLRYPIKFGGFTVAPDLELNTLVYDQRGNETGGEFGLYVPRNNLMSIETGIGLLAKYDCDFSGGGRLTFNSGLMAYREFGDCYNMELGIYGMDGTFLAYGDEYRYRGAASFGFNYDVGSFNMFGTAQYFVDSEQYMNFKGGISLRF